MTPEEQTIAYLRSHLDDKERMLRDADGEVEELRQQLAAQDQQMEERASLAEQVVSELRADAARLRYALNEAEDANLRLRNELEDLQRKRGVA